MKAISTITYKIYQSFSDTLKNHSIGISDKPESIKMGNSEPTGFKRWKVDTLIDAYAIERYFIEEYGMKKDGEVINNFDNDIYIYIY
ncbi:MAG TPA: hypothetical protein PKA80_01130 [Ignavibacteriaceae bacterium]|nr:hypothetical protein [Ignavibacteriaceae bacterium]